MESRINEIDSLIKAGLGGQARVQLLAWYSSQAVPRVWAVRFASLCRRVNESVLAVRVLRPYVRPTERKHKVATTEELAEYAANLTRLGAASEAQGLLKDLPGSYAPALLFRAFALASTWDYAEMVPVLRAYLKSPSITAYEVVVGKVNLVAALIYEGMFQEAEKHLENILDQTRREKLWLLYGNALELSAANEIYQHRSKEAEGRLAQAENLLADVPTVETVFVEKWRAIARLQKQVNAKSLEGLQAVREKALARHHWETIRDCDRFEAVLCKKENLLTHLYFGTPFASYQKKLLEDAKDFFVAPAFYDWSICTGVEPKFVDFLLGHGARGKKLKVGQAVFRLAEALAVDYYRPQRLATLYSRVFPGEFFNPDTSFKRVHFAMARLRQWLRKNRVPLHIVEQAGGYRYHSNVAFSLRVWRRPQSDPKLFKLVAQIGSAESVTRRKVEDLFGCSPKTANRLLEKLVSSGQLTKVSNGNKTRYTLR